MLGSRLADLLALALDPEHPVVAVLLQEQNEEIDRAFSRALTMKSLKTAKVQFHLPHLLVAHWIYGNCATYGIAPDYRMTKESSITWKVTNKALAMAIFGDRFEPRDFPGVDGRLNHNHLQGAISGDRRAPQIDHENILTITYSWEARNCTLEFWAEKARATGTPDGGVDFVPYRG